MFRLASILFTIVSTVMMGSIIVVALVMGYDTAKDMIISVVAGLLVSIPLTYWVTLRLLSVKSND